jgi:hypothetical protein
MAGLRQTLSLALLALLLVLVAGPVAAAQCRMRGACPMMKAAARTAPCPGAQGAGGMSAPMDCCQPSATPAPSSALPGLETPPAAFAPAMSGGAVAAARALQVAFSRAGLLHPLGLFTLHSVWRI